MMHRTRTTVQMIIVSVLLVSTPAQLSAQCMYEIVTELENPTCEGGIGIGATAINDHNVVVGNYAPGCGFDVEPFMWSEETGLILIPLPPGVSQAFVDDVNNNGEIVGNLYRDGVGTRAYRYKDGVWTELPPTGAGLSSRASGANDDGWVAGHRSTSPNLEDIAAFRWLDDVIEEFQPRSGDSAHANDINENESAVGQTSGSLQGSQRAFWWFGRMVIEIPPLPGGETSDASAINDTDMIVGTTGIPVKNGPGQRRSWLYHEGVQIDLGAIPSADHRTSAEDINDAGQIVGRSEGVANNTSTPFLWQHGQIHDLQLLIVNPPPGLNLSTANAINNNGWVGVDRLILRPAHRPLGDVNIDCIVDERDLIAVLDDWGPDKVHHPTDQVTSATFQPPGDGVVDGADLAVVLGNWSASGSNSVSFSTRR